MKNGDLVFFKQVKLGTARKSAEIGFPGLGFGILLGHVPPFQKEPPAEHIIRVLGSVGFLSFDDVGELLGPEQGTLVLQKYTEKYYGKKTEPEGLPAAPPEDAPSVVNLNQVVS